jgi:mevalonate kinase
MSVVVPHRFYAHGKLLLSGEYFVLDGALALALPTRRGQWMEIELFSPEIKLVHWKSYDVDGSLWFEGSFDLPKMSYQSGNDELVGKRLEKIFAAIQQLNPLFFKQMTACKISTRLEFSRHWGLGSSSTLLSCLGQWSQTDSQALLQASFGGSGYDIACAEAKGPIFYQRLNNVPTSLDVTWRPTFSQHLYFVYLGKKQDSREGIQHYRALGDSSNKAFLLQKISAITQNFVAAVDDLVLFEKAIQEHETLIANTLSLIPVKMLHFPDYWGEIKSLGAWGGDFVLATSNLSIAQTRAYFNEKGFLDVYGYDEMILN